MDKRGAHPGQGEILQLFLERSGEHLIAISLFLRGHEEYVDRCLDPFTTILLGHSTRWRSVTIVIQDSLVLSDFLEDAQWASTPKLVLLDIQCEHPWDNAVGFGRTMKPSAEWEVPSLTSLRLQDFTQYTLFPVQHLTSVYLSTSISSTEIRNCWWIWEFRAMLTRMPKLTHLTLDRLSFKRGQRPVQRITDNDRITLLSLRILRLRFRAQGITSMSGFMNFQVSGDYDGIPITILHYLLCPLLDTLELANCGWLNLRRIHKFPLVQSLTFQGLYRPLTVSPVCDSFPAVKELAIVGVNPQALQEVLPMQRWSSWLELRTLTVTSVDLVHRRGIRLDRFLDLAEQVPCTHPQAMPR